MTVPEKRDDGVNQRQREWTGKIYTLQAEQKEVLAYGLDVRGKERKGVTDD